MDHEKLWSDTILVKVVAERGIIVLIVLIIAATITAAIVLLELLSRGRIHHIIAARIVAEQDLVEDLHLELADPVAVPVRHALELAEELLARLRAPLLREQTGRVLLVAGRKALALSLCRHLLLLLPVALIVRVLIVIVVIRVVVL